MRVIGRPVSQLCKTLFKAALAGLPFVLAVGATPALADSFPAWQKQTTDKGCYLYQYEQSVGGMETDPQPTGYVWTGPCTPGQPISGTGTLYMQTNYRFSDGTYSRRVQSFEGTISNGKFEGPVYYLSYNVADNLSWNPNAGYVDDNWGNGDNYEGGCPSSQIYTGQMAEYGCQPNRIENPIVIPRVAKPYFAFPAGFAVTTGGGTSVGGNGTSSGGTSTYTGPTTYTSVAGTAVAPPKLAAPQETALTTVADGLISTLGGRTGMSFANGSVTVDSILASLRTTLGLNGNAALGGRGDLLDLVLGQVRSALGGANPGSTNGQIADLAMTALRSALSTASTPKQPGKRGIAVQPPAATQPAATGGVGGGGAKMVTAANVQSVIDFLASKGDSVTRNTDSEGKPYLNEAGNQYTVNFYDCQTGGSQCRTLQFTACFSGMSRATLAKSNEWNAYYVKVKTYINDNGWVCVEQPIGTGIGGVSYEVMDELYDAFLWFRQNKDAQFN